MMHLRRASLSLAVQALVDHTLAPVSARTRLPRVPAPSIDSATPRLTPYPPIAAFSPLYRFLSYPPPQPSTTHTHTPHPHLRPLHPLCAYVRCTRTDQTRLEGAPEGPHEQHWQQGRRCGGHIPVHAVRQRCRPLCRARQPRALGLAASLLHFAPALAQQDPTAAPVGRFCVIWRAGSGVVYATITDFCAHMIEHAKANADGKVRAAPRSSSFERAQSCAPTGAR